MPVVRTLVLLSVVFAIPVSAQMIVSHRGASYDAPENTLAAFRLAWEQQADAIEGDFHLTRDGRIVCIHDETTKRVAPLQAEQIVADSTLACLRSLDVGCWKGAQFAGERIPTLMEVLATVPAGKLIFVEIKCGPEILCALKQQLSASGLQAKQIVIICFQQDVVTQARQLMPQYKANWLTAYDKETEQSDWQPSRDGVFKTLKLTGATGIGSHANMGVLDISFVNELREARKEFHVWTVNDVAEARTLQLLGADSITTDRPALIRAAIETTAVQTGVE